MPTSWREVWSDPGQYEVVAILHGVTDITTPGREARGPPAPPA
ncbi:hypothetical protein [Streptomyces sp. NPDC051561]